MPKTWDIVLKKCAVIDGAEYSRLQNTLTENMVTRQSMTSR